MWQIRHAKSWLQAWRDRIRIRFLTFIGRPPRYFVIMASDGPVSVCRSSEGAQEEIARLYDLLYTDLMREHGVTDLKALSEGVLEQAFKQAGIHILVIKAKW